MRRRLRSTGRSAGTHRLQAGVSLVELIIVATLLLILAGVTMPVAKYSVKRTKEIELRSALREMRNAIDEYKRFSDAGLIPRDLGDEGYPPEMEILLEEVDLVGQVDRRVRFLRRVPVDPMTGEAEWLLLGVSDDPDSTSWGGENVFDVRSFSEGVGLNGIPYREW